MTRHRRHPRTRHDAEILCALDCGNPPDLCRCLRAMLHDRELVARPAPACALCGSPLRYDDRTLACAAPECRARRAQGELEPGARNELNPVPAGIATSLWRAVVGVFGGSRA